MSNCYDASCFLKRHQPPIITQLITNILLEMTHDLTDASHFPPSLCQCLIPKPNLPYIRSLWKPLPIRESQIYTFFPLLLKSDVFQQHNTITSGAWRSEPNTVHLPRTQSKDLIIPLWVVRGRTVSLPFLAFCISWYMPTHQRQKTVSLTLSLVLGHTWWCSGFNPGRPYKMLEIEAGSAAYKWLPCCIIALVPRDLNFWGLR